MPAHLGLFVSIMALLALAGMMKIVDPSPTAGALTVSGLPGSTVTVRALGFTEMSVGLAGLLFGGAWTAAVSALFYLAFALFVINALRRKLPISSCGCLGATDTPPTRIHVIVNLAAAGVLGFSTLVPLDPWTTFTSTPLGETVPMLAFSAVTVYLLYAVLAVLPLRRSVRRSSPITLSTRPPASRS